MNLQYDIYGIPCFHRIAYPPFSSFKLKIARVTFLFLSSLQWRRHLFVVMSVIALAIVLKVLFK